MLASEQGALMGHDYRHSNRSSGATTSVTGSVGTPGKRTLTESLPPNIAPVQRKATGAATDNHVHQAAQRGLAGRGSALPHIDPIQRAFGLHDVSKIQAHTGEEATRANAEIGAQGYATGNHVAFAGAPDLRTAAHEAAHVVQQRAGVQLKGGVGETGDAYEHNADEVAERVVRGESAADLLPGGESSPGSAVQRSDAGEAVQLKNGEQLTPGLRGPQGPKGDKGDQGRQGDKGEKGDKGESYDPADWERFHGLMSMAAGTWSFVAQKQKLAIDAIRTEVEKPKKPSIADAILEALIIGTLQAATGGIAGYVAGRITKAVEDAVTKQIAESASKVVEDAVAKQAAENARKALIKAISTSVVDAAKDGIKGTIRQIVQPKLAKLIQGGTDHATAFFEAQSDAAIDAGKEGHDAVLKKQGDIAALATTDKKAPLAAADALHQAADGAYDQAAEIQKDLTLKAWYSYKAQLTFGTTAAGGTDIHNVNTGMYETSQGEKPAGFLTIRVVKKPGWNDLSISLKEKPDPDAWFLKNESVYLPGSTKPMASRIDHKPVGDSSAANAPAPSPAGAAKAPKIPIMVFVETDGSMSRPLAILRNEAGETRADDAMSNSSSKDSKWFEDMTCWLAAKGGDKIITESHLLGDKHRPSGGDAAVMKGVNVLMAEVANLNIKDYIVPDKG